VTATYSPIDAASLDDPYPVYRVLRDNHPVYHNEEMGFWAFSRFADVWQATLDVKSFSNDPVHVKAWPEALNAVLPESSLDFGLFYMDPPLHNRKRALISQAFTPKRIAGLEARIRTVCRSLLEPLGHARCFDVVSGYASALPVTITGELLGIPVERRDEVRSLWTRIIGRPEGPTRAELATDVRSAMDEMFALFRSVVDDRRSDPRDDLVTALLRAELDGERLDDNEVLSICYQLNVAGNETTAHAISHAILLLIEHQDQLGELARCPDALPCAIEEILRFESPSAFSPRFVARDVKLEGGKILAGSVVFLLYGAANRDEREFPNPDLLDIRREAARHLAFGHGTHFCLGAHLARLETRLALEEMLPMLRHLEVGPQAGAGGLALYPGYRATRPR
jgi:cytochrome P450